MVVEGNKNRNRDKRMTEKVWQVLTDFAHFPDWNPFIREIIGTVMEGSSW